MATAHEEASSKRTQPLYPSTPADSAPLVEALREIQSVAYSDQEDATVESICGWLQEITDAALAAYDASHEAGGQS